MSSLHANRLGDVGAMARLVGELPPVNGNSIDQKRRMVADLFRLIGAPYSRPLAQTISGLSPRHSQTLERLLAGDSEKQIAASLHVSKNTVHCYVTAIYRRFDVSSRGELLARFVQTTTSPAAPTPSRV